MSDIALKPATTVINNAWSTLTEPDMWLPNSPNLNPVDYADGLSTLTINQLKHYVEQTVDAFG